MQKEKKCKQKKKKNQKQQNNSESNNRFNKTLYKYYIIINLKQYIY